ncbi:hypothetical protein MTX26_06185 [Bradyrhizobium sp. ISRA443]|uniref:hypothetical protein n=1 Tax=unclassified Bradyrhizobium TaxID=2631580 RepID=UPI00247A6551|nr:MULTISPECIES: hypothetical protein [unclassified Bradyrhizobium]WGS00432.1 hypothetical protein MTX23_06185 [Bradyrhizobium sp. ISRA436]WGS07322.1 hypothetical protein MTX18_06185 [Bradyrhizobium sp. ISRA437]WGS14206.1 hypothetical protein MTX26_06185 [Bradyrhizobium sp. ISRA443]
MRFGALTIFACALSLASVSAASAASSTASGSVALALAGVIVPHSPLPAAEKKAVAAFFNGDSHVSYTKKITVTADKIACRASNVDITARSCELTFGGHIRTVKGRAANEIFATEALAGVPSDGAAGTIYESLTKLSCTLDPKAIKENGGGADCTFQPGN